MKGLPLGSLRPGTAGPAAGARPPLYGLLLGISIGVIVTGLVLPAVIDEDRGASAVLTQGGAPGQVIDGVDGVERVEGVAGVGGAPVAGVDGGVPGEATAGVDAPVGAEATPGGAGAGGASQPGPTGGTATDVGLSPTTIRLGILLTDLTNPTGVAIGPGISVEEQRAQWDALIEDLNKRGGVAGRKVELVYRNAKILEGDQMRATCQQLARDDRVFAVLDSGGAAIGDLPSCYTRQHQVPLLANGAAGLMDEIYQASGGRLVTLHQRASRIMRSYAGELARAGHLKDQVCGVLADEFQGASPKGGALLEAALEAKGCQVAHRATMSADLATGASQVPVAVQQMRTKGVTFVLLLANPIYATQFVQEAKAQSYQPRYSLTDWLGGVTDFAIQNMPNEFDGALGVTATRIGSARANHPPNAVAEECAAIFRRKHGQTLDPKGQGYQLNAHACALFRLFVKGAQPLGMRLTRTSFLDSVARSGPFDPGYQSTGTLRPGKPDLADGVRIVAASISCNCWVATDQEFHAHN